MALFGKIKTPTRIPEKIVGQIEEKILLGELQPNSMLPSENELMKQFGVGRNTLREALRMLEASGIIKVTRGSHGGSVITQVTNEFISDFLIKAIHLGGFTMESLSQLRLAIEPYIVEMLAKEELDIHIYENLAKNIKTTRKLVKANKLTGYNNMDFHVLLASATGNPMFLIIMRTLRVIYYKNIPTTVRKKIQADVIEHHDIIFQAIKTNDPLRARNQMLEHLIEIHDIFDQLSLKKDGTKLL